MKRILASMLVGATAMIAPTPSDAEDIGIAWAGKSASARVIKAVLIEEFASQTPDWNIEFQDELADLDALESVITRFETEGKDAMIVVRSNGGELLAKRGSKIPTFITNMNNPEFLRLSTNGVKTHANMTGASWFLPRAMVMGGLTSLYPDIENVLILGAAGHPSTELDIKTFPGECEAAFVTCDVKAFISVEEGQAILQELASNYSAVLMNASGTGKDEAAAFLSEVGSTPLFGYVSNHVKGGAAAAIAASRHELGRIIVQQVIDVLINGKGIASMPFEADPTPNLFVNRSSMEKFDLKISDEIKDSVVYID